MLNGQWLNAGSLNSSGFGSVQVFLGVTATASGTVTAPPLSVRRTLGAAATATGTFPSTDLTRIRGFVADMTATADVFGGMSVEIDGVVHAYLAAYPTATAVTDPPALTCQCPLAVDATAEAIAVATTGIRRALSASGAATGAIDAPFLYGFVNLGALPPGQDSIVGTQRIRAFGFAAATMLRRKRLAVNATATAFIFPLPRLQQQVRMSVAATATATTAVTLYRRAELVVDATATATIDGALLFAFVRLTADLTATATLQPTLYMNTFDQAPITRTVFVPYQPRVTMPTRIRREVDA